MFSINKKAKEQIKTTASVAQTKLTADVIRVLIGHANVVYYNCETNTWNTSRYNGYKIPCQDIDARQVEKFKSAMNANPEFSQHYEFSAAVTMTIDSASYPDWDKPLSNPQYDEKGTAVVGNIIVKNKATGKYELYCKSWNGVRTSVTPYDAVTYGANAFAYRGGDSGFRAALLAAHIR